ncbi:hypothetical protein C8F01DRAFT_1140459 [Mycena amicta]|nr:hypothetical protein C8F01DRAFT_1140459 [Mycena amicta]
MVLFFLGPRASICLRPIFMVQLRRTERLPRRQRVRLMITAHYQDSTTTSHIRSAPSASSQTSRPHLSLPTPTPDEVQRRCCPRGRIFRHGRGHLPVPANDHTHAQQTTNGRCGRRTQSFALSLSRFICMRRDAASPSPFVIPVSGNAAGRSGESGGCHWY